MSLALLEELEMAELIYRLVRLQVMMHAHKSGVEYHDKYGWDQRTLRKEDEWWDAVYNDRWFDASVCREGMTNDEIRAELLRQRELLVLCYRDLDLVKDVEWW